MGIEHIFGKFKNKSNHALDGAYKTRVRKEDDIVTYTIMTFSVFFLGIIVLIKLIAQI